MNRLVLIILGGLLLFSVTVSAQAEVSVAEYQAEIQDLLDQYGNDFDDCFPELSSSFPTLPDEYLDIDTVIDDLTVNKWYHRKIPYLNTQIDEIMIHLKSGMNEYLIRVSYLYNEEESTFLIYSVSFFDNVQGSVEGEFWNVFSIPSGISQDSLKEIDVCKGTPGFMMISSILAITITLLAYSRYLKK